MGITLNMACSNIDFPCKWATMKHFFLNNIVLFKPQIETPTKLRRATAQVVRLWPLTTEVRVRCQASPCGICGEQIGPGTGLSLSASVFVCRYHSIYSVYLFVYQTFYWQRRYTTHLKMNKIPITKPKRQRNSLESNSRSALQEIPSLLGTPKIKQAGLQELKTVTSSAEHLHTTYLGPNFVLSFHPLLGLPPIIFYSCYSYISSLLIWCKLKSNDLIF